MAKQEKVWIVVRHTVINGVRSRAAQPVKAFDDRQDARDYAENLNRRSKYYHYRIRGVLKG